MRRDFRLGLGLGLSFGLGLAMLLPFAEGFVLQATTDVCFKLDSFMRGRQDPSLGKDVAVRPAGAKGKGVYALRSFEAGELIGRYDGEVIEETKFQTGGSSGAYAFGMDNGYVVDGEKAWRSNWLRYLNHSKRRANCESTEWVDGPFGLSAIIIVASRNIRIGEELLFDYGDEYWSTTYPWLSWSAPKRFAIDYL